MIRALVGTKVGTENPVARVRVFTKSFLDRLAATPRQRREIHSEERSDLLVAVTPKGQLRWAVRVTKRMGNQRRDSTPTLGYYPALSIEEARQRALAIKSQAKNSPTGRVSAPASSTVRGLAELYTAHLDAVSTMKPSARDTAFYLRKLPAWFLDMALAKVTQLEVHQLITDYRQQLLAKAKDDRRVRSLTAVGKLLQAVRSLFSYGMDPQRGGLIRFNPCAGVRVGKIEEPVLADRPALVTLDPTSELWEFWVALDDAPMGYPLYIHHKLELLTGKRGAELRYMRWEDITRKPTGVEWLLPGRVSVHHGSSGERRQPWSGVIRTKNGLPDLICLSDKAVDLIDSLRQHYTRTGIISPWVFPNARNLNAPMSPEASSQALANFAKISGLPHVKGHGLRRSFTTLASHLGISHEIKEKLLHHQPRSVLGRHYDMYEYRTEKRHAVQAIADYFTSKEVQHAFKLEPWSSEEDELLKRALARGEDPDTLARTLDRSPESVTRRIKAFGLRAEIAQTTRKLKQTKPKTNSCAVCTAPTANPQYCSKSCASKARWAAVRRAKPRFPPVGT